MSFQSLIELLEQRASAQPDRVGYLFLQDSGETSLTYRALRVRSSAVAARIARETSAVGERVALLGASGLDFVCAFYGILQSGRVPVPLSPPRAGQDLSGVANILIDAGAEVAVVPDTHVARMATIKTMSDLRHLRIIAMSELANAPDEALGTIQRRTPDDLAVLQYTSGSTTAPKGVRISHGNYLHNAGLASAAMCLDAETVSVNWAPLFHDMGLMFGVIHPLFAGYPAALMTPAAFAGRPATWLHAIHRHRATFSGGPNFAYDLCVQRIDPGEIAAIDLNCWRTAYSGAEPVRADTIESFSRTFAPCGFEPRALFPCYGLAEATLIVSGGPEIEQPVIRHVGADDLKLRGTVTSVAAADPGAYPVVSSGQLVESSNVVIVDPATMRACEDRTVGEIWIRGASVSSGYWRKPEASRATFEAVVHDGDPSDRCLRSGDLGFLDEANLFVCGRLKDLLIIHGVNHYPQDIEASVQASHGAMRTAGGAAFSLERDGYDQLVVVQEIARTWTGPIEALFELVLHAIVDQHAIAPSAIVFIRQGSLPKTTSGKVQRGRTREAFATGKLDELARWHSDAAGHDASPSSETPSDLERALVSIWSEVLGVAEVGVGDNFFDLGGHSHLMLVLHQRVSALTTQGVPLTALFQHPTVRTLSAYLSGASFERIEVKTASDRGRRRRSKLDTTPRLRAQE